MPSRSWRNAGTSVLRSGPIAGAGIMDDDLRGLLQEREYTHGWLTKSGVANYAPPVPNALRMAFAQGVIDADRRIRYDAMVREAREREHDGRTV